MKTDNAIRELVERMEDCVETSAGLSRILELLEIVRDQKVVLVPREFVRTFNKMIQLIEEFYEI